MNKSGSHYEGRDLEAMHFAPKYAQWVISQFAHVLKGSAIEIGAGSGNFSKALLNTTIDNLFAVEPSQDMHLILNKRLGRNNRVTTSASYLIDVAHSHKEEFDVACYFNVLEHIHDEKEELVVTRDVLKHGGHLCLFVPALPFLYSDFDRGVGHFRRYTKEQLVAHVQHAGFDILRVRYFDIFGIIPWYITMVLLKQTLRKGITSLYDRLAVPVARVIESRIRVPIGKNLVLIAKKR